MDVTADQYLKPPDGHGCQSSWSAVNGTASGGLFRQQDDCGRLQSWWDGGLSEWLVEYLGEDPSQLVCAPAG